MGACFLAVVGVEARVACLAVLALVIRPPTTPAAGPAPTPEEFGSKLAAYDSAFLSTFTARGTLSSSGTGKPEKDLRITCSGAQWAVEEVRHLPAYKAPAPDTADDPDVKYDSDGAMRLRSEDKVLYLFTEDYATRMNTTLEYVIDPNGAVRETRDVYNRVVKYPPNSMTLTLPKVRTTWALGRGFSKFITKVREVKAADGGMLRVVAEGMSMPQAPGTWTLLVDPSLGYIVREAEFVYPKDAKPAHIVKTTGTKTDGASVYPVSGSFTFLLGDTPVTYTIAFQSVKLENDAALYASVARVINGPPPPSTDVHDHRASPPAYMFVRNDGTISGQNSSDAPPTTPGKPQSRWLLFLLINLTVALAFAGVYLYRRLGRNHPAEPPPGAVGPTEAQDGERP